MRSKSIALLALASGVLALGVVGFSGLEGGAGLPNLVANADNNASRHLIVDASNFGSGSGDFIVDGIVFHYEAASVSDGVVTLEKGRVYMTMADYSGHGVNASGYRGDGFTVVNFSDFALSGEGSVIYGKPATTDGVTGTYSMASSVDLTRQNSGEEVAGTGRRRVHIECGKATLSFSQIDFSYECVEAVPSVSITGGVDSIGVGENLNLVANPTDVYDTPTYEWSLGTGEDTYVSLSSSGANATVTGLAATVSNVTVTVTMKVGGVVKGTDSVSFAVINSEPIIEEMDMYYGEGGAHWDGAGLFFDFVPSSGNTTYSALADIFANHKDWVSVEASVGSLSCTNVAGFQDYTTNSHSRFYLGWNATPPSSTYTVTVSFRDRSVVPNVIYRATAEFKGTAPLGPDAWLEAVSTDISLGGDDLTINAVYSKALQSIGVKSVAFVSSDTDVATVTNVGAVATVHGVAEGVATITLTVTDNLDAKYVDTIDVEVSDPESQIVMPWYTEREGGAVRINGAGMYAYVKYGELGFDDDGAGAKGVNSVASAVTVSLTGKTLAGKVSFQDNNAGAKAAGYYFHFTDADFSGVRTLTMTMPNQAGTKTATGTITLNNGVVTHYNGNPVS